MKELCFIIEANDDCYFFRKLDKKSQMKLMDAMQKLVLSHWKTMRKDENWEGTIEGTFLTNIQPLNVHLHCILGPDSGLARVNSIDIVEDKQGKVVDFNNLSKN